MNYLELVHANPGLKRATESTFGARLAFADDHDKKVVFRCVNGALFAYMTVPHSSWREGPCYQTFSWRNDTMQWVESHITFDEPFVR